MVLFQEEMHTTTLLLLKRSFHLCVSCELVNDQSLVSSCNQNPGSHAKHKLGKKTYCVDSGVKVYVYGQILYSVQNGTKWWNSNFPSFNWQKHKYLNSLQILEICGGMLYKSAICVWD